RRREHRRPGHLRGTRRRPSRHVALRAGRAALCQRGTAARRRLPALLRGHARRRSPRTTDLSGQGVTQMALPNFLIAGAPKAGTTALHVALARHPQLYLSRVKEPKYFLTDGRPKPQGGPGDARTLRDQVWQRDSYEA